MSVSATSWKATEMADIVVGWCGARVKGRRGHTDDMLSHGNTEFREVLSGLGKEDQTSR